ncbi:MAG: ROK family transcriptional regulator [Rhodospirillales bacterium]|nr:ROK family transcriptional regulator [Rhodospirillales bacterium]MDE0379694.1 ROK family transcriptional regulator [Rhodospirillales bacterium]
MNGYEPGKAPGDRNLRAVLREILLSGPVSRIEIARRVGVTASAVSRLARVLMEAGLVRETTERRDDAPVKPGRRTLPLEIDPQGGQVLGIGIGPSYQTVTLADIGNNVIAATELELGTIEDPDLVTRSVARESRRLIGRHLSDRSRLLGGLLMISASVDPERGSVEQAPYLGWGAFPLRARLSELLDLPIGVRSMTAAVATAELLFGTARDRSHVLALLCELGVGAAIIMDGRLIGGGRPPAGGLGAMKVTAEDGAVTTLDHAASGLAVVRRLQDGGTASGPATIAAMALALRDAVERDRAGDYAVAPLMVAAGREMGRVIVPFFRFAMPEAVLVAGPLAMSPSYMDGIAEVVDGDTQSGPVGVMASIVSAPVTDWSASCAMAVWEYLIETPLALTRLSVGSA